ncbi:Hypothetical protein ORPV_649 [Orpheovirus IHUMI-LCC2]|uniref:Uncharacterized protein n=1 Tax=Orpheovirus IHUMI-LCC2 TaxID=2023057 RepID=A0A2I2L4U3_9VIRU|nr:Hypothetical protein ORPV_649 [Orpheovirus IHUMI-LCC2]SNW62553.1 Hypothetical protein ORPV_649 [Orpheovirus IHUMI-LCC2]
MDNVDIILYITSCTKNKNLLINISSINKNIYNKIREEYYRKKIIERFIGSDIMKTYNDIISYYLSLSYANMIRLLDYTRMRGLLVMYTSITEYNYNTWTKDGNILFVTNNVLELINNLDNMIIMEEVNKINNEEYYIKIGLVKHWMETYDVVDMIRYDVKRKKFMVFNIDRKWNKNNKSDGENMCVRWVKDERYSNKIRMEFMKYSDRYYKEWKTMKYFPDDYYIPEIEKETPIVLNKLIYKDDNIRKKDEVMDMKFVKDMTIIHLLCNIKF